MIFEVSLERFLIEVNNHVKLTDLKYVNWYVSPEKNGLKKLNCYITATNGNETYYYSVIFRNPSQVNTAIRMLLSKKGSILGVQNDNHQ